MELLYIWIEDFRNIKNKGFNFSNKYDVSYNHETNKVSVNNLDETPAIFYQYSKVTFENKENHLDGFFHKNIINVSAIIGKNSTGKSNVLDFILTALHKGNRNRISNSKYFLLFKDDNQLKFSGKPDGSSVNNSKLYWKEYEVVKTEPNKNWLSIFYSNVADNREYIFDGNVTFNYSFNEINKAQGNKISYVSSDEFNYTWTKIKNISDSEQTIYFNFEPVAFGDLKKKTVHPTTKGILDRYTKAVYRESTSNYNRFKYGLTISLFSYLISKGNILDNPIDTINILESGIAENIAQLNPKIISFLGSINYDHIDDDYLSKEEYTQFIDLINKLEERTLDLGKVEKNSSFIIVDFNDDFTNLISESRDLFNKTEIITHDWGKLSSGMKAYLSLFSQLYAAKEKINQNKDKSIMLCIDEGDLYMHPEWQRNFLKDLIGFITTTFLENQIQIILTSHSPFLISDLPKESVILLDTNGVPNRQLKDPSSFGANIHQLFSKQFFLKDKGTIGAFAKEKNLNLNARIETMDESDLEEIDKLIEMIGEPVLKYRLEDKLKNKMIEFSNQSKIQWHQRQIEKLGV